MDYAETDSVLTGLDELIGLQEWLYYITPVRENLEGERSKVFDNPCYNPVFAYPEMDENVEESIKRYFSGFSTDKSPIGDIFGRKYKELVLLFNSVRLIGSYKIYTDLSVDLFGRPDAELIEDAYKLIDMKFLEEARDIPPESVKDILQEHMDNLGIGFTVIIDPAVIATVPDHNNKRLRIPDRQRSVHEVERLKVHEIGGVNEYGDILPGHILRGYLGSKQKYDIFRLGTGFYGKTEESLGVMSEKKSGVFSSKDDKTFRGRAVAAHLIQDNSFSDVYNELLKHDFSKDEAFRIAARAKRGIKDTSKPGGTTKDYFYFDTREVEKLSPDDMKLLLVGKVGVPDLPDIKTLIEDDELTLPEL